MRAEWCGHRLTQRAIQRGSQNQGVLAHLAMFRAQCERSFVPPDGSGEVQCVELHLVGRTRRLLQQRIPGVQELIVVLRQKITVKLVATRLGENVDASKPRTIVLRRKRIGVDADLADRRLRRQVAAGKAVDVDLSTHRPRCGAGERFQLLREFVGIVGKSRDLPSPHHDGVAVRTGIGRRGPPIG